MESIKWTQHRNKKILSIAVCQESEEEALDFLKRFVHELSDVEGGVHILADLRRANFWPKVALEWQKHQHFFDSKWGRLAVWGATGVVSIAVTTFLGVAKKAGLEIAQKVQFFENPDLALQWLVEREEIF